MSHAVTLNGNSHIDKVRWWHEQIVDIMLAFPHWSQGQIATHFDKTEAWLSTIIHSNVFKAYYAGRIEAHQSFISRKLIDKVEDIADMSLEAMRTRLEEAADEIPLPQLKETSEMALKTLGFGQVKQGRPSHNLTQINVGEGGTVTLEAALQSIDNEAQNPNLPRTEDNLPSPTEDIDYDIPEQKQLMNGNKKDKNKVELPFD